MTTLDWLLTISIITLLALTVTIDGNIERWTPDTTQIMLTLGITNATACLALTVLHIARATP